MALYKIHVNGTEHSVEALPDMPLLWVLRDIVGLTGTKYGCGVGACGACTVLVDGDEMRSCQLAVADIGHKQITTIEGLSKDGNHPLQKAWLAEDVPQCGYCQCGQIMGAAALLKRKPHPTDADIDQAMSSHICRCGTYVRIRSAIKEAAAGGSR
jgi:aerobic-type carbon monoxide dehydrogenase small subunit (CoxS/CutS family)